MTIVSSEISQCLCLVCVFVLFFEIVILNSLNYVLELGTGILGSKSPKFLESQE